MNAELSKAMAAFSNGFFPTEEMLPSSRAAQLKAARVSAERSQRLGITLEE